MRVYEASLQYTPTLWEVGFRTLDTPAKVIEYMKDLNEAYPMNEVFYVILLNTKTKPMDRVQITSGTLNSALVHLRGVFRAAVLGGAHSIICLHNHPSGDPAPSSADGYPNSASPDSDSPPPRLRCRTQRRIVRRVLGTPWSAKPCRTSSVECSIWLVNDDLFPAVATI